MGELTFFLGLQGKQKEDVIFISQDKYVGEILKKFSFSSTRAASTPMETNKALTKDEDGEDVDVHLYRSMIGSLMYLTSSRPDIMFSVCACSRFQVQPKVSHLNACKKQTVVANSTTEAEYIVASHCCGQVLWFQNQMLDYRFNFMQTKIHVGNESAICVVKNPIYHSKAKHIESRHHFIKDSYEKRLIEMVKIHTDHNVADLLTKAFDVGDEAVHKKLGDRMERAATTASSLEVEQDSVAYLQKSEGSEEFHQIIDFLNASHIQYALTKNPTIYVSFIKQFWKTATARTIANGEVELTATIDGQVKTITESSLRRHLKLEDNGGITTIPNSEIFEQLALIGYVTDSDKLTFQKGYFFLSGKEAVPMPHESPLHSVHSLGRDEDSLSLNELTDLCTSLSKKVEGLESELKQTKKTYSTAITKLIFRVKKLEQKVKTTKARRRARIVLSKDEEDVEDSFKQGGRSLQLIKILQYLWYNLSKRWNMMLILLEEEEPTKLVEDQGSGEKGEKEVSTIGAEHSTVIPEVSTAAANLVYIRRSAQKRKDKGKAIMQESEPPNKVKKRVQVQMSMDEELAKQVFEEEQAKAMAEQEQERINFEAALELQKQLDEREEVAAEPIQAQKIDWSDPAVLRYHAQLNRPYSIAEVRKNMVISFASLLRMESWWPRSLSDMIWNMEQLRVDVYEAMDESCKARK
ncbi:hypothetical protein Tco_0268492 [Tanacetum coccineum]